MEKLDEIIENAKRGPVVDTSQIPANVRIYFYIAMALVAGAAAGFKMIMDN